MVNNCDPTKMNVLLDLDSTLINSLSFSGELQLVSPEYQKKFKYIDMPKFYRIFERPYLQIFLDYLFENFNVSIFTAADKNYALFILKFIIMTKPSRNPNYFFFGYHSGISEDVYHTPKDLRLLWNVFKLRCFRPENTIIIDDLIDVKVSNPYQTIKIHPFDLLTEKREVNLNAHKDTHLLQIISILEERRQKFITQFNSTKQ